MSFFKNFTRCLIIIMREDSGENSMPLLNYRIHKKLKSQLRNKESLSYSDENNSFTSLSSCRSNENEDFDSSFSSILYVSSNDDGNFVSSSTFSSSSFSGKLFLYFRFKWSIGDESFESGHQMYI